jgi:isochorismate pyruvate lyase
MSGPHRKAKVPTATTASPDVQGQLRSARLAGEGGNVKLSKARTLWHGRQMTDIRDPADCSTMTEVRAGVDDVDRQVVALLKRRFGYMDAAARIKPDRSAVRDEWRKADVLAKVDASAAELEVDRRLVARLYEDLIETSIAHELDVFDQTRS